MRQWGEERVARLLDFRRGRELLERGQHQLIVDDLDGGIVPWDPACDGLGEMIEFYAQLCDVESAVRRQSVLGIPRPAPCRPCLPRVQVVVPRGIAAAPRHREVARSQGVADFVQQRQFPRLSVDTGGLRHRTLPLGRHEVHCCCGGDLGGPPPLAGQLLQRVQSVEERILCARGIQLEGGKDGGGELADMREPALEQREEDRHFAALECVIQRALLGPTFAREIPKEGGTHLPVGDGVVGDDLRDTAEMARTLSKEIRALDLGLVGLLVTPLKDPPDEDVEHLDDTIRELFGADDQVGEQVRVPFRVVVAAQRLCGEAAHNCRPLAQPVHRDVAPIQVVNQHAADRAQPVTFVAQGFGGGLPRWSNELCQGAVMSTSLTECVQAVDLCGGELSGDADEEVPLGRDPRTVDEPRDGRLSDRAEHAFPYEPVFRCLRERGRVSRMRYFAHQEGGDPRAIGA